MGIVMSLMIHMSLKKCFGLSILLQTSILTNVLLRQMVIKANHYFRQVEAAYVLQQTFKSNAFTSPIGTLSQTDNKASICIRKVVLFANDIFALIKYAHLPRKIVRQLGFRKIRSTMQ